ncbi:hypothetical protein ABVT39_027200 [Epinephelus coioides]
MASLLQIVALKARLTPRHLRFPLGWLVSIALPSISIDIGARNEKEAYNLRKGLRSCQNARAWLVIQQHPLFQEHLLRAKKNKDWSTCCRDIA